MTVRFLPAAFFFLLSAALNLTGQTAPQSTLVNQAQQLVFAGLRTASTQGQFNGVKTDAAGDLFLLLNQGDGVRILKTDAAARTLLAQTLLGASGDVGVALALDPTGNVYVTGTSASTALTSTSGAAIPTRTDASTNSFVAKFDPLLNPIFVTFTGGSRIAATGIAVTGDAVFVTGSLFTSTLPVTASGIQQSPSSGSSQNGFVEKFSSDGSTLLYATYLTGAQGNTVPAAIAAGSSGNAFIVGSTTAPGYPTVSALVPTILTSPSGFLTRLTPAGDAIAFSTFIPGPGLTSITLDSAGQALLLTGAVAPGQFPIQTVLAPIVSSLTCQSLLQLPLDGSTVINSILLAPGSQSSAVPTPSGSIWIAETLTAPLIPAPTFAPFGTGLALRINPSASAFPIDQSARFGGLPNANPTFASLPLTLTSLALDPTGAPILAGFAQPTASSSLLATETYDLPLIPTPVLPSTIHDALPTAATCVGSLCSGSAAFLAKLDPTISTPALALSADDNPFLILRNLGSAAAQNLTLSASASTISTNCPMTLIAAAECNILLAPDGSGHPSTLTATAANATFASVTVPAPPIPASTIVFSPKELDFGIQTSTGPPALRTVTLSNLGPNPQSFASGIPTTPKSPTPPFAESSSDCPGTPALHTLAPSATCHLTIALTVSSSSASDASSASIGNSAPGSFSSPLTPRPRPSPSPRPRLTSAPNTPPASAFPASSTSQTPLPHPSPTPRSPFLPPPPSPSPTPAPPSSPPSPSAPSVSTTSPPQSLPKTLSPSRLTPTASARPSPSSSPENPSPSLEPVASSSTPICPSLPCPSPLPPPSPSPASPPPRQSPSPTPAPAPSPSPSRSQEISPSKPPAPHPSQQARPAPSPSPSPRPGPEPGKGCSPSPPGPASIPPISLSPAPPPPSCPPTTAPWTPAAPSLANPSRSFTRSPYPSPPSPPQRLALTPSPSSPTAATAPAHPPPTPSPPPSLPPVQTAISPSTSTPPPPEPNPAPSFSPPLPTAPLTSFSSPAPALPPPASSSPPSPHPSAPSRSIRPPPPPSSPSPISPPAASPSLCSPPPSPATLPSIRPPPAASPAQPEPSPIPPPASSTSSSPPPPPAPAPAPSPSPPALNPSPPLLPAPPHPTSASPSPPPPSSSQTFPARRLPSNPSPSPTPAHQPSPSPHRLSPPSPSAPPAPAPPLLPPPPAPSPSPLSPPPPPSRTCSRSPSPPARPSPPSPFPSRAPTPLPTPASSSPLRNPTSAPPPSSPKAASARSPSRTSRRTLTPSSSASPASSLSSAPRAPPLPRQPPASSPPNFFP